MGLKQQNYLTATQLSFQLSLVLLCNFTQSCCKNDFIICVSETVANESESGRATPNFNGYSPEQLVNGKVSSLLAKNVKMCN